jgi:hypothetical protein
MINLSFLKQYGPLGNGVKGNMKMREINCHWSAQIGGGHLVIDDGDDNSTPLGPVSGETTDIVTYKPSNDEVYYYPSMLKIVSNAKIVDIKDGNNNSILVKRIDDNTITIKPNVIYKNSCPCYGPLKISAISFPLYALDITINNSLYSGYHLSSDAEGNVTVENITMTEPLNVVNFSIHIDK